MARSCERVGSPLQDRAIYCRGSETDATFIVMAQILDGARVRDAILDECRPRVAALPRPPGLAVVLVGHNPASEIYVRNKVKACAGLGIHSETLSPPDSVSTGALIALVEELHLRTLSA